MRSTFQTKKFRVEKESQINVWELLRVESFNTSYKLSLLQTFVNAVMKKDGMKEIEEAVKKESWDEVQRVVTVFEVFEPIRAVWNGVIAQCHVINVMPHVFDSYGKLEQVLLETKSAVLKQGIQHTLSKMQLAMKLLQVEIQENPDRCNPHIILPQQTLVTNFEENFKILALDDNISIRGGAKAALKVKTAVRWLKSDLLEEALLTVSTEIDVLHSKLFGNNSQAKLDETLHEVWIDIMKRCVVSMPGMVKLFSIGIKVASGNDDEMKLMVKVIKRNVHETVLVTPKEHAALLGLLCEFSLKNGDNFDSLHLLILTLSEELTKVLLFQPRSRVQAPDWQWVSTFLEWCFGLYSPEDTVQGALPIVEHVKQLKKNMDLISRIWFTQAILDYLWTSHKKRVPQTFVDWIENDLDLQNWQFGPVLNV